MSDKTGMSFGLLPNETLIQVFENANIRTLYRIIRVCRRWRSLGEALLYRELFITFNSTGSPSYRPGPSYSYRHFKEFEGHFIRHSSCVKTINISTGNLKFELFSENEISEFIKTLHHFENFTSLVYQSTGRDADCKAFWEFLGSLVFGLPQMKSLTLHRMVHTGYQRISSRPTSVKRPWPPKTVQNLGNLKNINIAVQVASSTRNHIDEIFNNLIDTLGVNAKDLVSDVDLCFNHIDTDFGVKPYKSPFAGPPPSSPECIWRLGGLRRLKFADLHMGYLFTDEIAADYSKLRSLTTGFKTWQAITAQCDKSRMQNPTYNSPFPNIETLGLSFTAPFEQHNVHGDDEWLSSLAAKNLQYFPKLQEFRAATGGYKLYMCRIYHPKDGEPVIGEGSLMDCSPYENLEIRERWFPKVY